MNRCWLFAFQCSRPFVPIISIRRLVEVAHRLGTPAGTEELLKGRGRKKELRKRNAGWSVKEVMKHDATGS